MFNKLYSNTINAFKLLIGRDFYRIDHTGVSVVGPDVASTQEQVVGSAIMYYNQLELENRIFDPRQ